MTEVACATARAERGEARHGLAARPVTSNARPIVRTGKALQATWLLGFASVVWPACSSDAGTAEGRGIDTGGSGGSSAAAAAGGTTADGAAATSGASAGGTAGSSGDGGTAAGGSSASGPGGSTGVVDAGKPDVQFLYDAAVDVKEEACAAATAAAVSPPVDIIWIVDQSGSMNYEINQIRTNINTNFASIIAASGLDYRVIMIATRSGTNQVCVNPPLGGVTCGAANLPLFFQQDTSIDSSNSLQRFQNTFASWSPHLRTDSMKVIIEVTDDQSSVTSTVFDNWLLTGGGMGYFGTATERRYMFHSIVGVLNQHPSTDPIETARCNTAVNAGTRYQELSILTGGLRFPVCALDYSPVFQQIASSIVSSVACELGMPQTDAGIVDPSRIELEYTPGMGGSPIVFPQVTDEPSCAGADGFYYDNPGSPTKLHLCPTTCTTVQADPGASVQVLLGCLGS